MRRCALALLVLATATVGCNANEADALRDQIRDDDYRSTYARAPGWEEGRLPAAGGPHGGFIDLYVNDVMQEVIDAGDAVERWPEGSIIVKDGWSRMDGGEFEYLSVMERRDGGWFWAEWRGNGRLISAGKNDNTCVGCHSVGEDQVRAFGLPPYDAE